MKALKERCLVRIIKTSIYRFVYNLHKNPPESGNSGGFFVNPIIENAETVLHHFGITNHSNGYQSTLSAMKLLSEDPSRATAIIKEIYIPIGHRERRHWKTVERNFRNVVKQAWANNPKLMENLLDIHCLTPLTSATLFPGCLNLTKRKPGLCCPVGANHHHPWTDWGK